MIKYLSNIPIIGIDNCTNEDIVFVSELETIFLDTETTGLCPHTNKPILLICGSTIMQIVFDLRTKANEAKEFLLLNKDKLFVAHNVKFDYKMLANYLNIDLPNWYCTEVTSRVLYNGLPLRHSLDAILDRHFNIKMSKEVRSSFINKADSTPFTKHEIEYAADDVKYLEQLFNRQLELINKFNMQYLLLPYTGLEQRFVTVLAKMELQGVRLDTIKWKEALVSNGVVLQELETKLKEELNLLKQDFKYLRNRKYNFSSVDDLFFIFKWTNEIINFPKREDLEEYKAKQVTKAKTLQNKKASVIVGTKKKNKVIGQVPMLFDIQEEINVIINESEEYSFGNNTIKEYLEDNPDSVLYDFLETYLEYKKLQKLTSTYGESFLGIINKKTNRIHSEYSQVWTKTGRLSSSKPNLQNLPQAESIRNCFVAEEGYTLLTIDYSGQELVILASQSDDELLKKAVLEDYDLHSLLAKESFSIINEEPTEVSKSVNKHLRNKHKPVLFGLIYGSGAFRIHKILQTPIAKAKLVKARIEQILHKAFSYLNKERDLGLKNKSIRDGSKSNRRRLFTNEAEHSIRKQAGNFKIQATGSSMIKEAMVEVEQYLQKYRINYPYIYIIMQVHDEIVCQLPIDLAEQMAKDIKQIMINVGNSYIKETVKINADYKIQPCWTK